MGEKNKRVIAAEVMMSFGYCALCMVEYLLLPAVDKSGETFAYIVIQCYGLMLLSFFLLLKFRIIYLVIPFLSYYAAKSLILLNHHFDHTTNWDFFEHDYYNREQMLMSACYLFVNVLPLSMVTRWLYKSWKKLKAENQARETQQALQASQVDPAQQTDGQSELPTATVTQRVVTADVPPQDAFIYEEPIVIKLAPQPDEPMSERSHLFRKIGLSLWLHLVCFQMILILPYRWLPLWLSRIVLEMISTKAGFIAYVLILWALCNIPLVVGSRKHPFSNTECRIVYRVFSGLFSAILLWLCFRPLVYFLFTPFSF